MGNAYRLFALFVLMGILMGCGGGDSQPVVLPIEQHAQPDATAVSFELLPPVDALQVIANRNGSAVQLERSGSAFEAGLSQHVAIMGMSAQFRPAWVGVSSSFDKVAYAIYSFNASDFSGNQLMLDWAEELQGNNKLWIGLSHWNSNKWDWLPGAAHGPHNLGSNGTSEFVQPGTADILVAIVLLGSEPALLERVHLVGTTLSDWYMFGHDRQHTSQSPFVGPHEANLLWTLDQGFDMGGSPTIGSDGTVYLGGTGGMFYAINPDGTVRWRFGPVGFYGSSAAISADGTVYFGSTDSNLYALNPNGSFKWSFTVVGDIDSSPAIGCDGIIYVGQAKSMAGTTYTRYILMEVLNGLSPQMAVSQPHRLSGLMEQCFLGCTGMKSLFFTRSTRMAALSDLTQRRMASLRPQLSERTELYILGVWIRSSMLSTQTVL